MDAVVGLLTRNNLTGPETALVDVAMAGTWWTRPPDDPGGDDPAHGEQWGPARTIRAQLLYQLLTGRGNLYSDDNHDEVSTPRAVWVRGARIIGHLDLEAATLRCPLHLDACFLDCQEPVTLRQATAQVVRLTACRLPSGLDADQLTTGDLALGQVRANGVVRLIGAHIGGTLDLTDGRFHNPHESAINADRAQVAQDLFCRAGFEADGAVQLRDAHVGGTLDLSGGRFHSLGGDAIDADRLYVYGNLFCGAGFEANGVVRLIGAHVGGTLDLTDGRFHNPGEDAIDADGMFVNRDLLCRAGFEATGTVWLVGAQIGGQLDLTGGRFRNPGGSAISADGVQVARSLFCRAGFEATGAVRLRDARIGGDLDLTGRFCNRGGNAISADGMFVDQDLFCRAGFEATGAVRLRGARIGGDLDLTGRFCNRGGNAIDAEGLRIAGGGVWRPKEVTGWLNLRSAQTTKWTDDPAGRATPTMFGGFRYDALHPGPDTKVGLAERLAWLDQDPSGYSPQPYTQLAEICRAGEYDWRAVLVASQNRRRRRGHGWRSWPGRAWGRLLWATVGYGYLPWRALMWLLALATIGTLVIMSRPDAELTAGSGAPARNALLYTVDMILPFVDLGYGKWVAHGIVLTATVMLVVFGWVLATAVAAALAGVLRRGD